ncbi:hypothetical protein OQJ46_16755 [Microbulbifer thermotolerans]|uniref:Uncharacterized protein n=1 Tax=Microbulbifer thermotolerans TaxID=252514 RepID=A0AB35HVJ3_MICTH|nr:hypothetical protein [Microbulbifer thermotolerans]MCX2781325.1 hypothetical protein [Microbulbifer thermotolerans]MCX2784636.1 hypothetical protein [Microbulbifer thermotolerans]MCX2800782.1 hypothetical protein [Microbulbifer thermotolerans]MCX2803570.1 hypothetical protein [Microbulbifer thermotolerans]MCX2829956.1 hypothetical protein [Microbulbifer thermotolerans]
MVRIKRFAALFFVIAFSPYATGNDSGNFNSCWAADSKEAEEIEATRKALPKSFSYAGAWPRMPVDTSASRPVVDCVKIKFVLRNGEFDYQVISSSRKILELNAKRKIESLKGSNLDFSSGVVIIYYFNPLVETQHVPFERASKLFLGQRR